MVRGLRRSPHGRQRRSPASEPGLVNVVNGFMPTPEQLLSSLTALANAWRPLAMFWHGCVAVFVVALIFGVRPSKRLSGILLALPFLSVSILSWLSVNPFNGIAFALIGILLNAISTRLPRESVQFAPLWPMSPGVFMFIFGWVYPYFLDESLPFSFSYSSPVGVIPCPTLSIGIGLALILNSLSSRKLSLILGISGIIYGTIGAVQLGVSIDWILLLGSVVITIFAFATLQRRARRNRVVQGIVDYAKWSTK